MAITGKSGVSTGVDIKASEIGEGLITASTTASAQALMGGSAVGRQIFEAATTAAAQTALGSGVVGRQIFAAATTAQVNTIVGGGVSSLNGLTGDLFITSDDASVSVSAGAAGVDLTVNDASISVTADQVSDATTVGKAIMRAATTAAALDDLGAGAVGKLVFAATTTAAVQDTIGAGAFGKAMLAAATTAAAQNALGVGAVGRQIFEAATTAAVTSITGGGAGFTGSAADVPFTAGSLVHVSGADVQAAINSIDGALERVSAASIGASTIGKSIFTAPTTAAVHNLLESGVAGLTVYKAATTAAAQNVLGIGVVGRQVFEAATTAAAQTALGGGVVGRLVFATGTTAAALDSLGGGAVGKTLFAASTTAAAQTIIGAFVSANFATTAQAIAGTNDGTVMNPVLTKNAIATLGGGAAGLTVIASGSCATGSPTVIDITSIPATYRSLILYVDSASNSVATRGLVIGVDAGGGLLDTNSYFTQTLNTTTTVNTGATQGLWTTITQTAAQTSSCIIEFPAYQSGPIKQYYGQMEAAATSGSPWQTASLRNVFQGVMIDNSDSLPKTGAIAGIRLTWNNVATGVFDGGTYALYGVN